MRRRVSIAVLCCGCAAPPVHPPTAVIEVEPPVLCVGDDHRTTVTFSGARSSDHLSLMPSPPGPDAPPLEFSWVLEGAQHVVVGGDLTSPEISVTTAGDRPLHAELTVVDADGGEATSLRSLAIEACPP